MGNKQFFRESYINRLSRETAYDEAKINEMYLKFAHDYPNGYMTKEQFLVAHEKYFLVGGKQPHKKLNRRKTAIKKRAISSMSGHLFRVVDQNHDGKIGKMLFNNLQSSHVFFS